MKYFIALLILNLTFCLQVKKSPFDLNGGTGTGSFLIVNLALSLGVATKIANDINGDGFADLVVGAPTYGINPPNGRVYVFNGSASGVTQASVNDASQMLEGTAGRKFGSALEMIDINGDGFSDLVVCEFYGGGINAAYYYLGSPSGLVSKTQINQSTTTEYCQALVVGDFNNDGFGDVAISDSTSSVNAQNNGNIYIYHGNSSGLNTTPSQILGLVNNGTNLGMGLALGDINADGQIDLVATQSSTPYIVSFISTGGIFNHSSSISVAINAIPILGDFNADGKADLAVSNFSTSSNTGTAYIFLSNGTSLSGTPSQTITGEAANYYFSKSLSVGDLNRDGITDLILGNYDFGGSNENGKIYAFYGCTTSGLCNSGLASNANLKVQGSNSVGLGTVTKFRDINGDGFPDLITGGPLKDARGAVFIFYGSASGIASSITSDTEADVIILGESSSGSSFGQSLY